jgi:indolepyruvate decarboxylase
VFSGFHATHKLDRRKTILATSDKMRIGLRSYEHVQLKDFLEGLGQRSIAPRVFKNPYQQAASKPLNDSERSDSLSSDAFFRILGLTMDKNATLVCDTDNASNFIADAYYLSMGFAVPAAIGATIANPDSRVYCLVGDGAFQMTGMEISTCAKYKLAPIVCVLNNDGYGTQRNIIDGPFNNIHSWDYAKLSEIIRYGKSIRVKTNGELEMALNAASGSNELTLIEVMIPRDDCSPPLKRLTKNLGDIRDSKR